MIWNVEMWQKDDFGRGSNTSSQLLNLNLMDVTQFQSHVCHDGVFSHRAVQRVWGQLQLFAHHRWGWWVNMTCHQNRMSLLYTVLYIYLCVCTRFLFQMKPQEKVFFKDPVKLVQSRLEHILQVCLHPKRLRCCSWSGSINDQISRHHPKIAGRNIVESLRCSWFIRYLIVTNPQIAHFQQTQMERVAAHFKHKSAELERRLKEVTEQACRWF